VLQRNGAKREHRGIGGRQVDLALVELGQVRQQLSGDAAMA